MLADCATEITGTNCCDCCQNRNGVGSLSNHNGSETGGQFNFILRSVVKSSSILSSLLPFKAGFENHVFKGAPYLAIF